MTGAATSEDTQTTSGLVISRNPADGLEVTHFKVTGITNGTLYKNDGTTQIRDGSFVTAAEGSAGLRFTPAANFAGSGSFTIQASISNGNAGLGGSTVVATIAVAPANDAPTLASWYDASWAYRKPITIDHARVSGGTDLTDFPVLIDLSADADLAAGAQANGNDILFTSADGTTKLSHEIETYTSATGALVAWVKVPSLWAHVDTTLYMYYGNSGAFNQQNATGVWDAKTGAVYHLGQSNQPVPGLHHQCE